MDNKSNKTWFSVVLDESIINTLSGSWFVNKMARYYIFNLQTIHKIICPIRSRNKQFIWKWLSHVYCLH